MLKVTLSNWNSASRHSHATFDVESASWILNHQERVLGEQLCRIGFDHPLLKESTCSPSIYEHIYEYDDFDGLMKASRFVYGTLIRLDNPLLARFRIQPSAKFVRTKAEYTFAFSTNSRKSANKTITIPQLNAIVSALKGSPFCYQDTLVLDKNITIHDLVQEINADILYETNDAIAEFCNQPDDTARFEIRYINKHVGFGVFAKQAIKKDDMIMHYAGEKCAKKPPFSYTFIEKQDCFKADINSSHFGNIARFVNHALPASRDVTNKEWCYANAKAVDCSIYGNNVVVFIARRDIQSGEQILISYGQDYFKNTEAMILWRHDHHMVHANGKRIKPDGIHDKRDFFKVLADCHVMSCAYHYRPSIVFLLLVLGLVCAKYC